MVSLWLESSTPSEGFRQRMNQSRRFRFACGEATPRTGRRKRWCRPEVLRPPMLVAPLRPNVRRLEHAGSAGGRTCVRLPLYRARPTTAIRPSLRRISPARATSSSAESVRTRQPGLPRRRYSSTRFDPASSGSRRLRPGAVSRRRHGRARSFRSHAPRMGPRAQQRRTSLRRDMLRDREHGGELCSRAPCDGLQRPDCRVSRWLFELRDLLLGDTGLPGQLPLRESKILA
jgi:hypothetical protein